MLQTTKFKIMFIVWRESNTMKHFRNLFILFFSITLLSSCSLWNKVFPPKYGCGTDGRNVGAEKLLDDTGKKKKEPKWRGG